MTAQRLTCSPADHVSCSELGALHCTTADMATLSWAEMLLLTLLAYAKITHAAARQMTDEWQFPIRNLLAEEWDVF